MELTADDIKTIREMRRWMQTNGQAGTLRPTYQRKVPRLITKQDNLVFYNDSSESVPAYGCIKVTGVTVISSRCYLTGEKPDGNTGVFVFNSNREIETGKTGICHDGPVVKAIVDTAASGDSSAVNTLYNGECVGPSGWELVSTPGGPMRFLGRMEGCSSSNVAYVLNRSASDCDDSSSFSDSVCQGIPGVDLDALPTVNASDVDYVLAIKDGCLVKVALSECEPGSSV